MQDSNWLVEFGSLSDCFVGRLAGQLHFQFKQPNSSKRCLLALLLPQRDDSETALGALTLGKKILELDISKLEKVC